MQDYYRFIAHLKFFAQRLLRKEHYDDESEEFLEAVKVKYQRRISVRKRSARSSNRNMAMNSTAVSLLYLAYINRIVRICKQGVINKHDLKMHRMVSFQVFF